MFAGQQRIIRLRNPIFFVTDHRIAHSHLFSMKSMLDWRSHLLLEKCLKHVAHSRLLGIGHVYGIIGGSWLSGWCYGQHWSCCGRFGRFTRRGNDMNVEINLNIVVTIASATLAIQYIKNWKYWIIENSNLITFWLETAVALVDHFLGDFPGPLFSYS